MAVTARKSMSLIGRFRRARDGATAVEFALIAAPFMALIFGILELGLVFMVSTTLDNATDGAARTIRTGQLQTSGAGTAAAFKNSICANMSWLGPNCQSNLQIDVRTFPQFKDIDLPTPTDKNGNGVFDGDEVKWVPGGPEDIVVVRAYYKWSLITPVLNAGLVNGPGNTRQIVSVITFRNEPYES